MCGESWSGTDHNEGTIQPGCSPTISYPEDGYVSRHLGLEPRPEELARFWIHMDEVAGLFWPVEAVAEFMTSSNNTFTARDTIF